MAIRNGGASEEAGEGQRTGKCVRLKREGRPFPGACRSGDECEILTPAYGSVATSSGEHTNHTVLIFLSALGGQINLGEGA